MAYIANHILQRIVLFELVTRMLSIARRNLRCKQETSCSEKPIHCDGQILRFELQC